MHTVQQIKITSVPVSDQDRAKAFYTDVLGLSLLQDVQMGPEMRWVQVAPTGSDSSLTLVTWFPSMPAGSIRGLVLGVADIDATAADLRAAGLDVPDVEEAPWGRFVQIADPDGNGLVLQQDRWASQFPPASPGAS